MVLFHSQTQCHMIRYGVDRDQLASDQDPHFSSTKGVQIDN